nr:galactan beta-1,4-galactosyltransferase GALS3-like [Ipomoea batatas]
MQIYAVTRMSSYKCEWVPVDKWQDSLSVVGQKILPNWGYDRIYTAVVLSGDEYEDSNKEELVGDSRQAQYESNGSMFLENRKKVLTNIHGVTTVFRMHGGLGMIEVSGTVNP